MEDVIYKHFRDERNKYYNPADIISANHYVTYRKDSGGVILSIGCDEGQVDVGIFWTADELNTAIERIVYGRLGN